jgi:hypothetical protein
LALKAPVLSLPETAFAPLQLPDAVQEVAWVELHVKVLVAPLLTDVGAAASPTVGAGVLPSPPEASLPPPHATRVLTRNNRAIRTVDLMAAMIGNCGSCREWSASRDEKKRYVMVASGDS